MKIFFFKTNKVALIIDITDITKSPPVTRDKENVIKIIHKITLWFMSIDPQNNQKTHLMRSHTYEYWLWHIFTVEFWNTTLRFSTYIPNHIFLIIVVLFQILRNYHLFYYNLLGRPWMLFGVLQQKNKINYF